MNGLEKVIVEMINELEIQQTTEDGFSGPFRNFNTEPKIEVLEEVLNRLRKKKRSE